MPRVYRGTSSEGENTMHHLTIFWVGHRLSFIRKWHPEYRCWFVSVELSNIVSS